MLRNQEGESEILLGNTQLIGLFFLLAVLLGISFTAGYMLGHGSFGSKKVADVATLTASPNSDGALPTKTVEPPPPAGGGTESAPPQTEPIRQASGKTADTTPPGKPVAKPAPVEPETRPLSSGQPGVFEPQPGQIFLQVAAELHDSAGSTAAALVKSGFNAHIVLAPNGKLYRVMVGPLKDKADLAATRESLKKKGFLQVIVRNY
jgi:cell division protein FtsN